MIKTIALAAVGATMLLASPAFAAVNSDSPPEPYTAPDPIYTQHKVASDVTMHQPQDHVSLTDNGSASGGSAR